MRLNRNAAPVFYPILDECMPPIVLAYRRLMNPAAALLTTELKFLKGEWYCQENL